MEMKVPRSTAPVDGPKSNAGLHPNACLGLRSIAPFLDGRRGREGGKKKEPSRRRIELHFIRCEKFTLAVPEGLLAHGGSAHLGHSLLLRVACY